MKIKATQYLRPLKIFIENSGANFKQVANLVDLKLTLDNRKKLPNGRSRSADPKNSIRRQALSFMLIGVFMPLMMLQTKDPYLFIFTFQIMLMVMNSITMLAEYSVSLFDTRDNSLLLPLPVNGQTMGWVRVTHILTYLLLLSFSMMIPGIIFSFIKFGGATAILFFVSVLLNTLFTLFLTVYLYLTLIKLMDGEKLKDAMMYLQVGLTIVVVIAYQIIPRYLMPEHGEPMVMNKSWYFLAIPPAWFTSLASLSAQFDKMNILLSLVAVIVPITSVLFIGKKIFYGFNEGLIKMDSQSTGRKTKKRVKTKDSIWFKTALIIMGVNREELPFFKMIWKLSGRERLFKQSVLPVLSYAVIIPAASILAGGEGLSAIESKYLIFLYFTIMSSTMLPSVMTIGNNKNAEWIFYALPNVSSHAIFKAGLKAGLARFFLPAYLIIALPLLYFKGPLALIDIISVFIFNYLAAAVILVLQTPHFVFSQEKTAAQGGKTALKMILVILIALPIGFLHSFLSKQSPYMPAILMAVYAIFIFLVNRYGMRKRFSWPYIKAANNQF